jgi:ankyrin repeat protein
MSHFLDFMRAHRGCVVLADHTHYIDHNYDGFWLFKAMDHYPIYGPVCKTKMLKRVRGFKLSMNSNLDCAVQNSDLELVQFLLKTGADPNKKDLSGWTPIQRVITRTEEYIAPEMIYELVQYGADLSYREPNKGRRAIDMARGILRRVLARHMTRFHWAKIRACVKLLSLHARAVVTANHPSRIDFSIEEEC